MSPRGKDERAGPAPAVRDDRAGGLLCDRVAGYGRRQVADSDRPDAAMFPLAHATSRRTVRWGVASTFPISPLAASGRSCPQPTNVTIGSVTG